jgi:hypothetical protein
MSGVDLSAFSTEELEALVSTKHRKSLKNANNNRPASNAAYRALLRGHRGDAVDFDYSRFHDNGDSGVAGDAVKSGPRASQSVFFGVEELDPHDYFGVAANDNANGDDANDVPRAAKKRAFLTAADAAVRKKKKKKKTTRKSIF